LLRAYTITLVITSDLIVFHETTNGPFNRAENAFAPWSPEDEDEKAVQAYMAQLNQETQAFL